MTTMTVAAVQAAYVLMDREATLAKVEELMAGPAVQGGGPGGVPRGVRAGHPDLDRRTAHLGRRRAVVRACSPTTP